MTEQRSQRDRGLTLIELLAAMAILAMVSLMAVQTLSGALFQRDVLARADAQGADLIRALALLRRDLEAVVPLTPGDDGADILSAYEAGPGHFTVMRGELGAAPGRFGRVEWRVSAAGQLTRAITVDGETPVTVPVLSDVRAFDLAAWGVGATGAPTPVPALPPGFELTFEHARHGTLRLVVAR